MKGPSRALSPTRTPRKRAQSSCCAIGTVPTLALSLCCAFLILMFTRLGQNSNGNAAFGGERNARKLVELPAEIRGVRNLDLGLEAGVKVGTVHGFMKGADLEEAGETLLKEKGIAAWIRVSKLGSKPSGLSEVVLPERMQKKDSKLVGVKMFEQQFEGQLASVKNLQDLSSEGVPISFEKRAAQREQLEESLQEDKSQKLPAPGFGGSTEHGNVHSEVDGQTNQLQDLRLSKQDRGVTEDMGFEADGQAKRRQDLLLQDSGVTEGFSNYNPLPEALNDAELMQNGEWVKTVGGQPNPVLNQVLEGRGSHAKNGLSTVQVNQVELEGVAAQASGELEFESGLSTQGLGQESVVKSGVIAGHNINGQEGTEVGKSVDSTEVPLTVHREIKGEETNSWQSESEEQKLREGGRLVGDLNASLEGVSDPDRGFNEIGFGTRQTTAEYEKVAETDPADVSKGHMAEHESSPTLEESDEDELSFAVLPEISNSGSATENGKGVKAGTSGLGVPFSLADADWTKSQTVAILGRSENVRFQRELGKAFREGSECMLPGTQLLDGNASLMAGGSAYGRCAFVGNSGVMKAAEHGDEIDSHDVVLRSNQAPTRGYEKFVGSKTSFRFLNKKWAVVYASANQGRGILLPREDPGTVLIASRSEDTEFSRLVTAVRETRPDVTAVHLSGDVRRCAHVALQSARKAAIANGVAYEGGDVPSTGFLAIFFLLQACEQIDVYGMSMERSTGDVAQSWPYHYFDHYVDSENLRAHPHHSFEMEGDLIRALASEMPARIRVAT